jgi:hypothetical protein
MSISVGHNRPITCTGFRPGRTENPAGLPIRRLGIRAALPAKRLETTPGNDRNGCSMRVARVRQTSVAIDTMTAMAVDTMTAAVIDTTIAGGGRNSLSTTDAFDTEPY